MSEDEFTKLFKYMEKRFDSVDKRLDAAATQESLDRLMATIDNFIKRLDDNEAENAARDAQFARLVEWAREVSKKTGVPLPDL